MSTRFLLQTSHLIGQVGKLGIFCVCDSIFVSYLVIDVFYADSPVRYFYQIATSPKWKHRHLIGSSHVMPFSFDKFSRSLEWKWTCSLYISNRARKSFELHLFTWIRSVSADYCCNSQDDSINAFNLCVHTAPTFMAKWHFKTPETDTKTTNQGNSQEKKHINIAKAFGWQQWQQKNWSHVPKVKRALRVYWTFIRKTNEKKRIPFTPACATANGICAEKHRKLFARLNWFSRHW